MKGTRHGSATVEFPSDREVLVTRKFDAPAELVFDALTKPEHVRLWFGAKELEVCEIDFRVGGAYHFDRLAFKDQATRDSSKWLGPDGVHADEGGQVSLDRLEDYLSTRA
jgi:Activator of Hsp90 ATPase homolog 1-like protein